MMVNRIPSFFAYTIECTKWDNIKEHFLILHVL